MKNKSTPFDTPKKTRNRKKSGYGFPIVLIAILVASIAGVTVAFNYKASVEERSYEHAQLSSKLRNYIIEIVKLSNSSSRGDTASFKPLLTTKNAFTSTLDALRSNDATTNKIHLSEVTSAWNNEQKNIDIILNAEKTIRLTKKFVSGVNGIMPSIISSSEQLITRIIRKQPVPNLVIASSHQLLLAQRILSNVNQVAIQSKNTSKYINALIADTDEFRNILENMLKGNNKRGIVRIKNTAIRAEISDLIFSFETIHELVTRANKSAPELTAVHLAADRILQNSDNLLSNVNNLIDGYRTTSAERNKIDLFIYGLEGLALLTLIILIFSLNRKANTHLIDESQENKESINAIVKLQNEIAPIAKGDLTNNASVEKGITESLAKTVNISINSLRQLVRNIDIMALQVSQTADETQKTATQLAKASDTQAQKLSNVTSNTRKMLRSFQAVTKQAQESSQLAGKAVEMAAQGGHSVRNTLNAMQTLTDDISHTASSVKRLGESSQEIGNIVELINDIADQTNILALNAAIKASVAGESGQNFTTVADEVQQLAERVTQATKKIESLVNSIQLDTNQAVTSMEHSYTDVIEGSKLARTAGDALLRIETVSAHLSEFINNVSDATLDLTEISQEISREMNSIKKTTDQNLAGTKQTATLTGKLSELAKVQQTTIKGFKIPKANA